MKHLKIILLLIISLLSCSSLLCADIPIFPTGPVFQLQPALNWAGTGTGNFNNNYFFVPNFNSEFVCVYLSNNDSSTHQFGITEVITGNPSENTPSDGSWSPGGGIKFGLVAASPSTTFAFGIYIGSPAKVSVNLSAGIGTGTVSVIIIQSTSGCYNGYGMNPGLAPVATITSFQDSNNALNTAFYASTTTTNPASGTVLINFPMVCSGVCKADVFLDKMVISASASATITIGQTNSQGTGCTTIVGPNNMKGGGSYPTSELSTFITTQPCTTAPTLLGSYFPSMTIPAGTTILDLKGFVFGGAGCTGTCGIDVAMAAALTGTISVSTFWYEK